MTEKTCFVIAPIGDRDSPARKKSDQVLRHLIRPVVEQHAYAAQRADELNDDGLITNQIIERLLSAELVIADMSGRNPNVFYELAVRHAVGKPVIHLIEYGQDIPFDLANVRSVQYAVDDPDMLIQARKQLAASVAGIDAAGQAGPNPVTAAVGMRALRQSDEPARELTGEILTALADLRVGMASLSKAIGARVGGDQAEPFRPRLTTGSRVRHATYGLGEITSVEPDGVTVILFEDGTKRNIMWDYAPIQLEEPEKRVLKLSEIEF